MSSFLLNSKRNLSRYLIQASVTRDSNSHKTASLKLQNSVSGIGNGKLYRLLLQNWKKFPAGR